MDESCSQQSTNESSICTSALGVQSQHSRICALGGLRRSTILRPKYEEEPCCPKEESCPSPSTMTITESSENLSQWCNPEEIMCDQQKRAREKSRSPTTAQCALKKIARCAKLAYKKMPLMCSKLGDPPTVCSNQSYASLSSAADPKLEKKMKCKMRRLRQEEMKNRRCVRLGITPSQSETQSSSEEEEEEETIIFDCCKNSSCKRGQEIGAAIAATYEARRQQFRPESSVSVCLQQAQAFDCALQDKIRTRENPESRQCIKNRSSRKKKRKCRLEKDRSRKKKSRKHCYARDLARKLRKRPNKFYCLW